MCRSGLAEAVAAWVAEDVVSASARALAADLVTLRGAVNRLEAEFTRRLAAFDAVEGAAADGLSTAAWLRDRCRLSPGDAAARVATARRLREFPAMAAAFAAGRVSEQHVRATTAVRDEATRAAVASVDAKLADAAQSVTPLELRRLVHHVVQAAAPQIAAAVADRQVERRYLSLSQTFDGAWRVDGLLDPESGATVRAALDGVMAGDREPGDRRHPAQARADALTVLARHALDAGHLPVVAGERPHLVVQVPVGALAPDADAAGSGAAARADVEPDKPESCGVRTGGARPGLSRSRGSDGLRSEPTLGAGLAASTLTRDAVRRLGCDARVTRVLLAGESQPVDVGRATRTVPPHLRRALEARDQGCAWDGCDRPPHWTDAHHIVHWADGGATALDNLVLLCRRHHRAVHEGRAPCPVPRAAQARAGPPGAA